MKKARKKIAAKFIILLILSLSLSVTTSGASYRYEDGGLIFKSNQPDVSEAEEPEDWEDWSDVDLSASANETEISSEFTPELVSENENFSFWYDTTGADIYIRDKRSGHIWSNTVNDDYYNNEEASVSMRSQLLQVTVSDETGGVTVNQLCDAVGDSDKFNLTCDYSGSGMILNVELIKFSVSFDIDFSLDEDGLSVSVPAESVKQADGNRIVNIAVMPYFGAARTDLEGYILIPDGPGAIIEFDNMESKEERVYSYSLYGQSEQDMDKLMSRDDQDIKNMMLPVFGVKNHENGFLAAVTEGAENTYLNVVPYGYQSPKLGRAYFTFMYLYTEQLTVNGKSIDQIMPDQELSDRTVKYFLLDDQCGYSDMARVYRSHLEKTGILKNKLTEDSRGVSLDIVMGVKKNGMFFDSLVAMTDFEDVKNIVTDLRDGGINNLEVTLQGWNDGGLTALPTPQKTAGKLGGKRELNSLLEWLKSNRVKTFLYNNFFEADTESKSVNLRKEVIRDYVRNMVIDLSNTKVMVNVFSALDRYMASARDTGIYNNAGFSLARAGQWLWNSYENGNDNTRKETVEAITKALEECLNKEKTLQVYGGNQYVLTYADSLREIPDTASNYYYETASVPFYQMVVSGYVRYTSIAGNMAYDADYQKLKWIEYGSIPYYIITQKNSLELIDSEYDKLFSSEYSMWGDQIKAVNEEFTTRLAPLNGAEMTEHHIITDKLSSVKYSNGAVIYINYGDEDAQIGDITVESMDYSIVQNAESGVAQ